METISREINREKLYPTYERFYDDHFNKKKPVVDIAKAYTNPKTGKSFSRMTVYRGIKLILSKKNATNK